MYKVKRLDLPTCFSIECQGGSEANTLVLEGKCGEKSGVMEIPKPTTGAELMQLQKMTSDELVFQKNFFYFLWFSTNILRYVIFSSKLSQVLVLSAISIFNGLTSVLILDPDPIPPTAGRVLCTVLIIIPWEASPSLIEFHSVANKTTKSVPSWL